QGPLGVLNRVPVLSGAPRHIMDDVDTNVTFSPDGNRMAFIRGYPSEESRSVIVVNADGTGERRLATVKEPAFFPIDPSEPGRPTAGGSPLPRAMKATPTWRQLTPRRAGFVRWGREIGTQCAGSAGWPTAALFSLRLRTARTRTSRNRSG